MHSRFTRHMAACSLLGIALVALFVVSCGDADPTDDVAENGTSSVSTIDGADLPPGSDTGGPADRQNPLPPDIGTVTATIGGEGAEELAFEDVNARVEELPGGGTTRETLFIEAHQAPRHLRLDLFRDDAQIDVGTYSIEGTERQLNAAWEQDGNYYRAVDKATGSVELTEYTDDRAKGSYDVTLYPIQGGDPVSVSGDFDVKVNR